MLVFLLSFSLFLKRYSAVDAMPAALAAGTVTPDTVKQYVSQ